LDDFDFRNLHVRARWKPRYRLKMAHLYTPAGAMGQGWKNQIHGDYFRRIFDRRLELRRSPRNRAAEVVIFLSAYKNGSSP
jgi:hypothetical protein